MFLFLLPLALESVQNGQINLVMTGLLMAAVTAADRQRWWAAALCIALASSLKIYPLALGLLLLVAYPRRLAVPLLVSLALAAGLPFLFQRTDYVLSQYQSWLWVLGRNANRRDFPPVAAYRDLWLLVRVFRVPISYEGCHALRLGIAAACAAALAWLRWRGAPSRQVLTVALALSCAWIALCGPSTESSTYVILAPPLAWALLDPTGDRPRGAGRLLVLAAAASLSACVLSGLFPHSNRFHAFGPHPLGAASFLAAVFLGALRTSARPAAAETGPALACRPAA
jgi:hypothetical protein